jgi:hypothetical protein
VTVKIGDPPYGRLTVTGFLPKGRVACLCACGRSVEVSRSNLTSGNTKSCGCLKAETLRQRYRARREAKRARPLR